MTNIATEQMHDENERATVLVTNVKFNTNRKASKKPYAVKDLPKEFSITLPKNIQEQEAKNEAKFRDNVETFAYNFMTKKFGYEVSNCQIFLPLSEDTISNN